MNPLRFFDYVFYRIASLYNTRLFGNNPAYEEIGAIGLGFFQSLNFLTLLVLFGLEGFLIKNQFVILFFGLFIVLTGLNLYRYKKFVTYSDIGIKLTNKSSMSKGFSTFLVIIYAIASFVALILISVFRNEFSIVS